MGDVDQYTPDDELKILAHQINVCFGKSDDYLVTAAQHLAKAKRLCRERKIPFKDWIDANSVRVGVKYGYTLARCGEKDDVPKAIEDLRTAGAERTRKCAAKVPLANSTQAAAETVVLTSGLRVPADDFRVALDEEQNPPDEIEAEIDDEIEVIDPQRLLAAYGMRASDSYEYALACIKIMRRFREDPPKRMGKSIRESLEYNVRMTAAAADTWAKLAELMRDEYGENDR